GGVLMTAVTGVDDRDGGVMRGTSGSAFLGMTHCGDVCIARNNANGVGNRFTLGSRGRIRARETEYRTAEVEHSSLEGQAGTGRRLIEQGSQLLACADLLILGRVSDDAVCEREQVLRLLYGKVKR